MKSGCICKKIFRILLIVVFAAAITAWVYFHRDLIKALIKKQPKPKCPHWLPRCIGEALGV